MSPRRYLKHRSSPVLVQACSCYRLLHGTLASFATIDDAVTCVERTPLLEVREVDHGNKLRIILFLQECRVRCADIRA
jgi:hypothetical protein